MARETIVSESVVIDARPDEIWALVSDPRNFGRWSPENRGATLIGEDETLEVGSTFWGHNRRGPMRWATYCRVTATEPGERFAFEVLGQRVGGRSRPRLRFPIATWEYRLEETPDGTRVTETWKDDRETSAFGRVSRTSDRLVTGGPTFADLHRRNMRATLERLKEEAEA